MRGDAASLHFLEEFRHLEDGGPLLDEVCALDLTDMARLAGERFVTLKTSAPGDVAVFTTVCRWSRYGLVEQDCSTIDRYGSLPVRLLPAGRRAEHGVCTRLELAAAAGADMSMTHGAPRVRR